MPIEAVVILIVTILAFVAIGVWLAATGTRPILPEGKEYTATNITSGGEVEVIVRFVGFNPLGDSGIIRAVNLSSCVHAAAYAWGVSEYAGMTLERAFKAVKTTRILIMSGAAFDAYAAKASVIDPPKTNGFQIWTPQRVGEGPPLLVIRGSLGHVQQCSVAIHEALHALAHAANRGHQNLHEDVAIWRSHGPSTIEARAHIIANASTAPEYDAGA